MARDSRGTQLAGFTQEVSGGVAVGPVQAESRFALGGGLQVEAGPGTTARWAFIWFGLAIVYILLVARAASR